MTLTIPPVVFAFMVSLAGASAILAESTKACDKAGECYEVNFETEFVDRNCEKKKKDGEMKKQAVQLSAKIASSFTLYHIARPKTQGSFGCLVSINDLDEMPEELVLPSPEETGKIEISIAAKSWIVSSRWQNQLVDLTGKRPKAKGNGLAARFDLSSSSNDLLVSYLSMFDPELYYNAEEDGSVNPVPGYAPEESDAATPVKTAPLAIRGETVQLRIIGSLLKQERWKNLKKFASVAWNIVVPNLNFGGVIAKIIQDLNDNNSKKVISQLIEFIKETKTNGMEWIDFSKGNIVFALSDHSNTRREVPLVKGYWIAIAGIPENRESYFMECQPRVTGLLEPLPILSLASKLGKCNDIGKFIEKVDYLIFKIDVTVTDQDLSVK